jgi:tetratricopeptide (TPR) repeat protein
VYVIEDLYFHAGYWAEAMRGTAEIAPQDFFAQLAKAVACPGETSIADQATIHATDSVEFFHGAIAIHKKLPPETDPVEHRRPIVEQANRPEIWGAFALYLINHGAGFVEAEASVRKAIALSPEDPVYHHQLSIVLEKANNLSGALDAARAASAMNPSFKMFADRIEELEAKPERPI